MGNPFIIAEDQALKSLCQGMTVSDNKNATRPVQVWFGYPDIEVRDQSFPYVTIDLIDIVATRDRQTSGVITDVDYNGTITPASGITYAYDTPVAYDLVYQITTHSRHPRHDRALMFQLFNKFPAKFGKLAVPNQLGTETGYRSMFLDGFVKRDAVEGETGNRRTFRNILSVRVVSEMSPTVANAIAGKAVQTVYLDKIGTPPTGYVWA